jgi:hypothetical protein
MIRNALALVIITTSFGMQAFVLLTARDTVVQVFDLLTIAAQSILPTLYVLQQLDCYDYVQRMD